MLSQRIRQFFIALVAKERSSDTLALSFCMGIYIAFSPFIGLHTAMTFFLVWFLGLHMATTFAASILLHNPWTTLPIYGIDYVFGEWLLKKVGGLDTLSMNPSWMSSLNDVLHVHLGLSNVSFWSFMIGGNVLGIVISVGMYPLIKRIFIKFVEQVHGIAGAQG